MVIISQVPDMVALRAKTTLKDLLVPLIAASLLWIMILVCQSLGIFQLRDWRVHLSDIKLVLIGFLIFILVKAAGGALLFLLGETTTHNQQLVESAYAAHPVWLQFLLIAIVGPIMEEFIFRGFLIHYYFSANYKVGIVVSSLLFGLFHQPTDLVSLLIYASGGLVLGIIYQRTKRIEIVILIHCLNNSLMFLPYLFGW
ncbi:CPBP family intramembrane glutamic endopeptidase [Enterococcus sp. AZ163]|uniref:CPBP family intramembrane glutamic endopeptidase n=1 Tax=Enterococcus sp. AZ163 TaxID=2774638 RepID=UPI003D2A3CBE